ncbi:MAG: DNA polymerase Y family protein, partial [Pseudomonadota bacterium]
MMRKKPWWDAEAQNTQGIENDDALLVLVTHGAKGTRISALGPDGLAEGLWLDMKLNDARAMLPDLKVATHDTVSDALLHKRLAHWLLRYSPSITRQGDDAFVIDVAGCTHLFGGERAMAHDVQKRLNHMGFTARLAFADTPGAAMALVGYGAEDVHILPSNSPLHALDVLPAEALRLDAETLTLLKRLGLKTIGDVRCVPRMALERRFYENKKSRTKSQSAGLARSVQWRLDQLTGAVSEPLTYITEPQFFRATKQCPALALEMGAVEIALHELLPKLCAQLQQAGIGARTFCLSGYRADGGVSSVEATLSQPVRDPDAIARLFKDRLDRIDCGFGIDLFVLAAFQVSILSDTQSDGFDTEKDAFSSNGIAAFADILTNRGQGSQALRLLPRQSHVPERAQRFAPVNTAIDWQAWAVAEPVWSPRPLRLLARPEPARVTAELPDSP